MTWRRINWLIGRSLFLYLVLALLLFGLVNRRAVHNNRMNFLKQSEIDVKAFALGAPAVDPAMLRMAVRYYRELLRFIPADGLIHGNLGFCYFYLKDYSRAWEEYQRALALEPQLWTLRWDEAMFLFQNGNVKEAARIWEDYLDNQDTVREYFKALKDQLRMKRKDVLYLVERMEKRFAEDETETYIKLSEAYFFLKQYDKAKAIAEGGLKLFPGNRWLHYLAGLSDFSTQHFAMAAGHFAEAIAGNPSDINAYYYHGLCAHGLGDEERQGLDFLRVSELRAQGIEPLPMPKDSARLHLNTELFFLRYHVTGRK